MIEPINTGHITSLDNKYIIHSQMIDVVCIGHRLWAKGSIAVLNASMDGDL
jgi:hypothetical protein